VTGQFIAAHAAADKFEAREYQALNKAIALTDTLLSIRVLKSYASPFDPDRILCEKGLLIAKFLDRIPATWLC